MFGRMFFDFCQESGYDKILQVLGATPRDFLQNLDALHDHLATIYPGILTPQFLLISLETLKYFAKSIQTTFTPKSISYPIEHDPPKFIFLNAVISYTIQLFLLLILLLLHTGSRK